MFILGPGSFDFTSWTIYNRLPSDSADTPSRRKAALPMVAQYIRHGINVLYAQQSVRSGRWPTHYSLLARFHSTDRATATYIPMYMCVQDSIVYTRSINWCQCLYSFFILHLFLLQTFTTADEKIHWIYITMMLRRLVLYFVKWEIYRSSRKQQAISKQQSIELNDEVPNKCFQATRFLLLIWYKLSSNVFGKQLKNM